MEQVLMITKIITRNHTFEEQNWAQRLDIKIVRINKYSSDYSKWVNLRKHNK